MRQRLKRLFFEGEVLRLMGIVALAKPLGMIVQILMARYFGAGEQYDAYALAVFLVSYVGSVFGAVYTYVVLPFVIKLRKDLGPDRIHAFQNATILLFLVPAGAYMLILMFKGDLVIALMGPELPQVTKDFAVRMIRYMAAPGLLLLVLAMFKAILNINRVYRLPAALPVINSLVMLIAIVVFHGRYGIWSLAIGFACSPLVQLVMMVRLVIVNKAAGLRRPSVPEGMLRKLWSLSWMMLVTQAIVTLYHFIDKIFAARLEAGSISSIAYAATLVFFGSQLFNFSLGVVMFTRMSEMIAEWRIDELNRYVRENIERAARVVVPGALAVSLAAPQVVRVLFQRGEFNEADTARTAAVLSFYILGLPAMVVNLIVGRIFFSMQRMGMKVLLSVQYLVTNVVGNLLLIDRLGVLGLAISTAVTINLHLFFSAWALEGYKAGITGWKYMRLTGWHYLLVLLVFGAYRLTSFGEFAASLVDASSFVGAAAVAAAKAAFVFGLYLLLFLVTRRFPTIRG